MEPVKISDIRVLSYDDNKNSIEFRATNDKTGSAEDLGKKYVGARVQVVKTPLIVGTVVKVIVGDWYITDNPKITNAYQAHKFEILEYPDGWKEREERRQRKKKEMGSAEAAKAASVKGQRRNVKSAEKETKTEVEKKQNDEEKEDTSASRVRAAAAAAAPTTGTTDASPNAEAPQAENETNQERSLIGATVRIKKGRYRGLVGTIKEKQSIRRIQLDSISTPFAFEDIEVVEYANHGSIDGGGDNNNQLLRNDEFARKYQKYVGATVRVMQPPDLAGTEGKVIRVIVLGDWYITDNPDIPMAFPSHKFDVVKYASEDEEEGGGHEEEEESERRGDDEEVHVIKDEEENEDSDDNRKQPHKENTAVMEKKESIDASSNDDVKKGGDVASVEEKDRKEEEVAPKEKEDVEMKEVGKNDEEEKPKGDSIDNDCDGNDGTNYDPETSPLPAVAEDEKMAEEERDNKKDDAVATSSTSIDSKKGDSLNDDVNENKDEEKQDGDEVKDQTEADASAAVEGKAEATNKDVEQDCNTTKDEGNKLNAESPPSFESNSDPLPGATVYITKGANSGITGKLVMTEERGWWTVEGITGKVSSSKCKLIDDGGVDLNKVREWYKGRNLLERMPGVVKLKKVPGKPDEYEHVVEEGASRDKGRAAKNTDAIVEKGDEGDYKRKVMQTDFTGSDLESKKRKLGVVELDQPQQRPVVLSSILPPQDSNNDKSHPKLRDDAPPEPSLNPILVQASTNDDAENPKPIMQLLPASLRHLPQDTKIEIFNRRTGRIMKGNDAVLLSNLPRALMDHAEYEPIIPPTGRKSRITSRVGRSGPNIRVSHNIVPQTRIRASRVEGRKVLVTGGEYRGLTGKIDSCIPGGWYLVSNLMTNDKLDVVISSRNLELIPQESTNDSTVITDPASPSKKQGVTKVRIHLKAAKLRLDAFIEEKKRLEIHGNLANGSWKGQPQLKRIIAEIAKSKRLIGNLEIALERRKSAAENSTGPQDTAVSSSSSSAAAAAVAVSAANK